MNKRIAIWIVGCFLISIGVVVALFAVSKDVRQQPGSFLREFPPHPALEGEAFDLEFNSYYIAGATDQHVYLGNYTSPLHMLIINTVRTDTQHVKLNVKGIMDQKFWSIRVKVDPPYYYVTDGAVPIIYRGNVHDWSAEQYAHDNAYYQDIVPITKESFFIRALGKPDRQNILGKITTFTPHLDMKPGILQKQVDGIFCTDGMMQYNKTRNELIYLYRYRNEYIVLDTNLNVLRRQHTIDTTTRAKIEVKTIESSGSSTFSSPSRIVNRTSSISDNLLFVNSMLLAKNEHPKAHDNATVIDVYTLATGEYLFSFYIYDYKGREKLRMFSVLGDKLFALFDEHLQVWKLEDRHFGPWDLSRSEP